MVCRCENLSGERLLENVEVEFLYCIQCYHPTRLKYPAMTADKHAGARRLADRQRSEGGT